MVKVSKKILSLLDENKIKYEIVEHKTTYTAYDTAATTVKIKIKSQEVVKTLVMKSDKDCVLALVPSNKMLDKTKLKKSVNNTIKKEKKCLEAQAKKSKNEKEKKKLTALAKKKTNVKKIEFAKEAWMKNNILGKIGAVPPFSQITKLQIFIDGSLLRQKQLYLGSGEYEYSIKMTPAQYRKLEKELVKGSFGIVK